MDGLIPASAGRILVDGRVVTKPGPDRAVVFQDASLLPWRTVLGNVRYGLECLKVGAREAKERATHFINLVGLSGFEPWLGCPASSITTLMNSPAACSSA